MQFDNRKPTRDKMSNDYRAKLIRNLPNLKNNINITAVLPIFNQYTEHFETILERKVATLPSHLNISEVWEKYEDLKKSAVNEVSH